MNKTLIENFEKLVIFYKDDESKNQFQINSMIKALDLLKKLDFEIKSKDDCENIKGFGKGIISKIDEILKTNTLEYFKNKTIEPQKINDLHLITGLGEKKIKDLQKINITCINDLKNAIENKQYKSTHHINVGLKYYQDFQKRIPREEIEQFKEYFEKAFKLLNLQYDITGSYRRGNKDCGDIDILVTKNVIEDNIIKKITNELLKLKILVKDGILTPTAKKKFMGTCCLPIENSIKRRLDIRIIDYESYYSALLYFTGSDENNKRMRLEAIKLNMKLNEYGLFKDDEKLKVISEKDIFDYLNLKFLEPCERM
jgi:DNA polymerase beta